MGSSSTRETLGLSDPRRHHGSGGAGRNLQIPASSCQYLAVTRPVQATSSRDRGRGPELQGATLNTEFERDGRSQGWRQPGDPLRPEQLYPPPVERGRMTAVRT